MCFPGGSDGKESACNARDPGLTPGLGRSPGEGHGYPLQYSCLENPMDRRAWWVTIHGVTKSQTQLSYLHFHFFSSHTNVTNSRRRERTLLLSVPQGTLMPLHNSIGYFFFWSLFFCSRHILFPYLMQSIQHLKTELYYKTCIYSQK